MNRMWSPWRMEYILQEKKEGCVFCDTIHQDEDSDNLILVRGEHSFIIMNRYPYNNGHLMVAPYAHVNLPTLLRPEALYEMAQMVNICIEVLKESMMPDGFNVGMNLGASAGAGIKDHIHTHIVPRWTGDTNFMPVISDTRVIVEGLMECYTKLRPLFDCRCEPGWLERAGLETGSDES